MKSRIAVAGLLSLLMLLVVDAGSLSFAKKPAGFQKGKKKGFEYGRPRGFTQGKKTGWHNEYPPGWDKKSKKDKAAWKASVKKGRNKVAKAAKKKGFKKEHLQRAGDDFEKAARKGFPVEEAEALVIERVKKGAKGKELSEEVATETERRLKDKDRKGKDKGRKDKEEKEKASDKSDKKDEEKGGKPDKSGKGSGRKGKGGKGR